MPGLDAETVSLGCEPGCPRASAAIHSQATGDHACYWTGSTARRFEADPCQDLDVYAVLFV